MTEALRFIIGFALSAGWSLANYYLTMKVINMAVLKEPAGRIRSLLLIKFPVLYLAGFLVLNSRAFPSVSLLTGLAFALVVILVKKMGRSRS